MLQSLLLPSQTVCLRSPDDNELVSAVALHPDFAQRSRNDLAVFVRTQADQDNAVRLKMSRPMAGVYVDIVKRLVPNVSVS